MSEKHKKVCRALNYFEHFLIFISAVSGCVSVSAFSSLVGVPVNVTSSAIGLTICTITAGILSYQPIFKKKKTRKHDHIMLLAKN